MYEIEKKKLIKYAGNYSAYVKEKARRYLAAEKEYRRLKAEEERLNALIEKFKTKPRKASFARTR
ncbi:MAG: ABC transporter ATP-binding protein, partial [Lachnospiraceae bacterium]|nr:ABC transporter ATP-binding protein [Lachnospiraceae bacterium]